MYIFRTVELKLPVDWLISALIDILPLPDIVKDKQLIS